jgi:hypothetical protein
MSIYSYLFDVETLNYGAAILEIKAFCLIELVNPKELK